MLLRENRLKFTKNYLAAGLVFVSAVAIAVQWFDPNMINNSFEGDKGGDYSDARTQFMRDQIAINANGSMKPGDTVTMKYSDGAIVTFTLGKTFAKCVSGVCRWSSDPWDNTKEPEVKQGPKAPTGAEPKQIGLVPGMTLPVMAAYPVPATRLLDPTVTITQDGGNAIQVNFSPTDYGGGAAGGGYATSGNSCARGQKCPPIMEH